MICKHANGVCICGKNDYCSIKLMTNEEWRRNCSTEEFAKWLSDTLYACMRCGMNCHIGYCPFNKCIIDKEDAEKWLKEAHKE